MPPTESSTPSVDATDPSATRIEVSRVIAASPAAVFAVLSDPQGHVAIDGSGMLMGADGDRVRAVGDTFVVHMDREALGDIPMGEYDVTVTIASFERDREISWTILGRMRPPIGHVYGYRLRPEGDGTRVTSFYDWSDIHPEWRAKGIFPVIRPESLTATLGILARTVLRGYPCATPKG
ncbi:SRPBCC family protein [Williamsia herbipolensis]|uniref:SRPBCC family protein n=1 Tax=Williamsia herbipolensis TaxID=1603258 RepID=UPI0005F8207F|nr:SRPBCC family protein [Williamsia herbipolensis]